MDGIATVARSEVLQARHSRLRTIAAFLAALVVFIALLTLLAWIAHVHVLLLIFPGVPPMRINSAIGVLAAGMALWIRARGRTARVTKIATASAALTAQIGAATALEYPRSRCRITCRAAGLAASCRSLPRRSCC